MTWGEKTFLIAVIILAFGVLCFCINATPDKSQSLIRPEMKKEISERLRERGFSQSTTVEITEAGYRAEFNGKWIRL